MKSKYVNASHCIRIIMELDVYICRVFCTRRLVHQMAQMETGGLLLHGLVGTSLYSFVVRRFLLLASSTVTLTTGSDFTTSFEAGGARFPPDMLQHSEFRFSIFFTLTIHLHTYFVGERCCYTYQVPCVPEW